jgi:protein TonB
MHGQPGVIEGQATVAQQARMVPLASDSPSADPLLPDTRRKLAGILFVLALHALLGLLFLSLAPKFGGEKPGELEIFSISEAPTPKAAEPEPATKPEQAEAEQPRPEPVPTPPAPPAPAPPVEVPPVPDPVALAPPPAQPPAAPRPTYGPPDIRPKGPPDSERVEGAGPNGEPLYAAAWYREPYDDELSGFLSTARGPGWGLIACRTVPSYRVEDCVIVGEYPKGSGIANSVLAAAWQFQVRPPRIGGRDRYGEWVRIRIDYGMKPDGRAR